MKFRSHCFALLLLASVIALFTPRTTAATTPRAPNIILFLIDDWGWTYAASFSSKLYEPPHIDRLVDGIRQDIAWFGADPARHPIDVATNQRWDVGVVRAVDVKKHEAASESAEEDRAEEPVERHCRREEDDAERGRAEEADDVGL